jgi:hypothetical protein
MSRSIYVASFAFTALFAAACGGPQPTARTSTRTETKTEDNTGEKSKDVKTTTTVDQPDGSQTTTRTDRSTHTVPPAPVPAQATPPIN